MTTEEYGKIISKNLKRIAYEHQKTQADIARDLKLKQATISSWMNGTRVPRMDKIDLLCHYFNCRRVDIMEKYQSDAENYFTPDEKQLIVAYRKSDDLTKQMIIRLLGLEPAEKENIDIA